MIESLFETRAGKRIQGVVSSWLPSNYGILHHKPLIVLSSYRGERTFPFFQIKRALYELSELNPHFVLYLCSYLPQGELNRLSKHRKSMDAQTASRIRFMTNTQDQLDRIQEIGFSGVFCSHNALIDEDIFTPLAVGKKWGAIYDAQLHPIKRHHLARNIADLVLTYTPVPWYRIGYAKQIKTLLKGATFANGSFGRYYCLLLPSEIASIINQSHVGLCLSSREGAMYASIQYLLAGIPVVTTASRGGRDEFFDVDNSLEVEDDAEAVSQAVRVLADRQLDPQVIRERTLKRIWEHRTRLFHYLETIVQDGSLNNFSSYWPSMFYNKLTVSGLSIQKFISNVHKLRVGAKQVS